MTRLTFSIQLITPRTVSHVDDFLYFVTTEWRFTLCFVTECIHKSSAMAILSRTKFVSPSCAIFNANIADIRKHQLHNFHLQLHLHLYSLSVSNARNLNFRLTTETKSEKMFNAADSWHHRDNNPSVVMRWKTYILTESERTSGTFISVAVFIICAFTEFT